MQALAGHADLITSQHYAHMVTNDLQAAIATLERSKGVETEARGGVDAGGLRR